MLVLWKILRNCIQINDPCYKKKHLRLLELALSKIWPLIKIL